MAAVPAVLLPKNWTNPLRLLIVALPAVLMPLNSSRAKLLLMVALPPFIVIPAPVKLRTTEFANV